MVSTLQAVYMTTWPGKPDFTEKDYPDLSGRVYLVTGGSYGLGYESARLLAGAGAKVILASRSASKMQEAIGKIQLENAQAQLEYVTVDYDDLATIKPASETVLSKTQVLHGVIHNAGGAFRQDGAVTVQGHDKHVGINVIAPFLLQRLLDPILERTAESAEDVRIVWITSMLAFMTKPQGGVYVDDLDNKVTKNPFLEQYNTAKALDYHVAINWGRHHPDSKVKSVAVHPGYVYTPNTTDGLVDRALLFVMGHRNVTLGGYSQVAGLLKPDTKTGDFFMPWGKKSEMRPDIDEAARGEVGVRVWEWLDKQIKEFV